MSAEYVDITPELLGKADPDQRWIERRLDMIDPWRHEQGHDGATDRALRQLVLELRDQLTRAQTDLRQQLEAPLPETGGPAFPAFEVRTHDTGDLVENASQGMTLRDYFAAKALFAVLEQKDVHDGREYNNAAWMAYQIADAMLKARAA